MAWNPSPEVQIARDAAKALSALPKIQFVNRCVVLFTTIDGQLGYASYGTSSALCGQARRLGDEAYKAVHDQYEDILDHHHRKDCQGETLDGSKIDWAGIEAEVTLKLRLLRESLAVVSEPNARHMYVRDLVLPATELLARFCSCVNIEESATD